ncbi:Outer membrane protein (porin) [Paraburkholderia steynii]|uniref:Outer membrane protein (Porin) n=2 Tax=Paraburkholderia steynii TaxID=1245441 RepID=A0A7Z7FKX8_9BURK|nr:Outer membrane protein (porin) [Paraburkholderia steynii]
MDKGLLLAGTALLCLASAAQAQSTVTLYGNVDGGLAFFNNVGGKRWYGFENGNFVPDLFGLTGTEDLGGGLKATFKLEASYNLSNGSLLVPSQLFQRKSIVGLSSDKLGELTLGYQPSFMFDVLLPYSVPYHGGGLYTFHQGNLDELGNTNALTNTVKYFSPSFGGISFGLQFAFGNEAGNFATKRKYAAALQYKNGPLSLGMVYTNENNRVIEFTEFLGLKNLFGTPLPTTDVAIANKLQNIGFGGSYKIEALTLHAVFTQSRVEFANGSSNANTADFGVNYFIGYFDSVGAGGSVENFAGGHWTTLSLSNAYFLSKRTTFYQQFMYQKASGANAVASMLGAGQASGNSQLGVAIGIQHYF